MLQLLLKIRKANGKEIGKWTASRIEYNCIEEEWHQHGISVQTEETMIGSEE